MPSKSASIVRLLAASILFDVALALHQHHVAFTITRSPHSCIALQQQQLPVHSRSRGRSISRSRRSTLTTAFAIPDISSLITPSSESVVTKAEMIFSPQILAATTSATLTYISLLAYFDRPRGSLTIPDPQTTLLMQSSRVPNAGLGLFVTQSMPKGTILGTYAGVLRPAQQFYDGKCRNYPQAVGYSWRFTDDQYVIDPTDSRGEIRDFCLGGSSEVPLSNVVFASLLQLWRVSTVLCRINEPPIGVGGPNVSAKEKLDKREVVFELIQDVYAGQELYLDYGLDYDRSRYGP